MLRNDKNICNIYGTGGPALQHSALKDCSEDPLWDKQNAFTWERYHQRMLLPEVYGNYYMISCFIQCGENVAVTVRSMENAKLKVCWTETPPHPNGRAIHLLQTEQKTHHNLLHAKELRQKNHYNLVLPKG